MIKEWFEYDILRFIVEMEVDTSLAFVAVVRLCEIEYGVSDSHDFYPYGYKTRNLTRVGDSVRMFFKVANGAEKKIYETEAVRPIYLQ